MIPNKFEYREAGSAEEAIQLLGQYGDEAKLLAGGHSLLPLMKLRLASPAVLVDIGRLGDLSYVRDGGDHVAVGALTRHRDVETAPRATKVAPRARQAAGRSDAGSPWASDPPMVPRWRTWGSPTWPAPRARSGASAASSGAVSTSRWRVRAPTATWSPPSRT